MNDYKFTILPLLLLVYEVEDGDIAHKAARGRHQVVLHRDAGVHQREADGVEGGRLEGAVGLEHAHLQVDLRPRVILQHY